MEKKYERWLKLNIKWMCDYLSVSRSGYYSYRANRVAELNESLTVQTNDYRDFMLIKYVYDFKGYSKGSRTIAMMMPRLVGIKMNRKKIQRLMNKFGLICPIRKANPLRKIMKALRTNSVFINKLNRQFDVQRPGYHLLTDITYIFYGESNHKRCFLSVLKDASTNEIVTWSISESLDIPFVIRMLNQLKTILWIPSSVVIHSDQGCHYTSNEYRNWLSAHEIAQSMSRRGNCWDNAPVESFFGHAKDNLQLRSCESFDDVIHEIENYIDYYNNYRPQVGLGKLTPVELREALLLQPSTQLMIIDQQKSNNLMIAAS